jgi:hypothetical protein
MAAHSSVSAPISIPSNGNGLANTGGSEGGGGVGDRSIGIGSGSGASMTYPHTPPLPSSIHLPMSSSFAPPIGLTDDDQDDGYIHANHTDDNDDINNDHNNGDVYNDDGDHESKSEVKVQFDPTPSLPPPPAAAAAVAAVSSSLGSPPTSPILPVDAMSHASTPLDIPSSSAAAAPPRAGMTATGVGVSTSPYFSNLPEYEESPSASLMEELAASLECLVCREQYDWLQRMPMVLNICGHSVCLICLQQLRQRQAFRCPTCRLTAPIDAACKPNYQIQHLIDTHQRTEERARPPTLRHQQSQQGQGQQNQQMGVQPPLIIQQPSSLTIASSPPQHTVTGGGGLTLVGIGGATPITAARYPCDLCEASTVATSRCLDCVNINGWISIYLPPTQN